MVMTADDRRAQQGLAAFYGLTDAGAPAATPQTAAAADDAFIPLDGDAGGDADGDVFVPLDQDTEFVPLDDGRAEGEPEPDADAGAGADAAAVDEAVDEAVDGAPPAAAAAPAAAVDAGFMPRTPEQWRTWKKARDERDMGAFHALPARARREIRQAWQVEAARAQAAAGPAPGPGPAPALVASLDALIAAGAADEAWVLADAAKTQPGVLRTYLEVQDYKVAHGLPAEMPYSQILQLWHTQEATRAVQQLAADMDVEAAFARYQRDPAWAQFSDAERDQLDPTHARYAALSDAEAALALAETYGAAKARAAARQRAAPHVERLRQQQQRAQAVHTAAADAAPAAGGGGAGMRSRSLEDIGLAFDKASREKARNPTPSVIRAYERAKAAWATARSARYGW